MPSTPEIGAFIDELTGHTGLTAELLPSCDARLRPVSNLLETFYDGNGQGYLNDAAHRGLDARLALTARSTSIVVRDPSGRILSTVRMTPFAFEASELVGDALDTCEYSNHIELSRLVSWRSDEYRTLPTTLLLARALCWAAREHAGFVALAKLPQRRVFSRFGLTANHDTPLALPLRPGAGYWFLQARFDEIVQHAGRQIERLHAADPLFKPESTSP
ncbi:hypothetical protein D7W79_10165 [Corallococcus exercitus]|uniref:GNAT family N-acetyltransferase n=1 Tax=Corallococcus exercitus TaxID=2316736 RepID=A0A3A8IML0_9BACT|nr:hypothetical protein [Corallococcus exercitus]NOK36001.1 hypothetical protein [Corallococcus exercitus]RKG79521.1 hypothetical protein D7W79_10165 [Corallococcus exercitus]